MVSNCTLQGGQVEVQLNEVFQILADGAEEEEALLAANAPQTARDKIWLPGVSLFITCLCFLDASAAFRGIS
jgi:hypothetical protein